MKKVRYRILILLVAILLILSILIINGSKIRFIQLIKDMISDKKMSEKSITEIDVTNLSDNGNLEHEHIIKTNYDNNRHWDECIICGQKSNIINHMYTDSWTHGSANNCSENNMHVFTCKCGYSYENSIGRKAHGSGYTDNAPMFCHQYWKCTVCNYQAIMHECYLSNGTRITCNNPGVCRTCGFNYTRSNLRHYTSVEGSEDLKNLSCNFCGKKFPTKFNKFELSTVETGKLILDMDLFYENGALVSLIDYYSNPANIVTWGDSSAWNGTTQSQTGRIYINLNSHIEKPFALSYVSYFSYGGELYFLDGACTKAKADVIAPVISNINISDNSSDSDWKKIKPITITGTENYCSNVSVKIEDDERNEIFNGNASVSNNNYSIQCTPQIEVDQYGRKFIATVTDTLGNSSEQEFTIRKVDSTAPVPVSENSIGVDYWAKSKEFTFKASDKGIGNVSIAFNDSNDLGLATGDGEVYSRDYIFTGDVYTPKELSVLYRDELGNTSIQKVTIDKLDNTIPTITNVSIHNNKLLVTANDVKQGFGEGSGVAKYRYLASTDKLENPEITLDNSVEVLKNEEIVVRDIYKMKYIYVVAEDLVRKCEQGI